VTEVNYGNKNFYVISSFLLISEDFEINIRKIEYILIYSKEPGLLIAADSNARTKHNMPS